MSRLKSLALILCFISLTITSAMANEMRQSIGINEFSDFVTPDSIITEADNLNIEDLYVGETVRSKTETPDDNSDRNWWYLLEKGQLNLADTTVVYPKFLGFCVKVYNWGNEFFNGTDPEFVTGTGHRWKAFLKSDNWVDSYAMNIGGKMPVRIMSDIYCNAGGYLQYMAVSMGYSLDLSNIIGNKPSNHKKLEFSFSCQRFSVDAYFNSNTGGSYLRTFGDYNDGHIFKKPFPGVRLKTYGIDAYYFFNHKKYSQGAAYNFSRIQKRSAISWILGYSYTNIDITMDFTQLPYPLKFYLTVPSKEYRFHYNAFTIAGGFGYNCVFARNWLFNITIMPVLGINECYLDSSDGSQTQVSLGAKAKSSTTYNFGDFFFGIQARFNGLWYRSHNFSFFSSIENLAGVIGVRF